jgi:hypothetical protein
MEDGTSIGTPDTPGEHARSIADVEFADGEKSMAAGEKHALSAVGQSTKGTESRPDATNGAAITEEVTAELSGGTAATDVATSDTPGDTEEEVSLILDSATEDALTDMPEHT